MTLLRGKFPVTAATKGPDGRRMCVASRIAIPSGEAACCLHQSSEQALGPQGLEIV